MAQRCRDFDLLPGAAGLYTEANRGVWMVFWIIVAAIALLSASLLALAALRGRPGVEPAAAYDLRIYRDQLKEVDRDLARGIVAEADAERTRTEIARRLLAADAQMREAGEVPKGNHRATLMATADIFEACMFARSQMVCFWLKTVQVCPPRFRSYIHKYFIKVRRGKYI